MEVNVSFEYIEETIEYHLISEHYGDRCAERSGVRLMNHIDEGLEVLSALHATEETKRAFCIHPLLQDDKELAENKDVLCGLVHPYVLLLAMEYRNKAQAYLCRPHTDNWTQEDIKLYVGTLLPEVRNMLIADKAQNRKDFLLYHKDTHPRSEELSRYFQNWLYYLYGPTS